jgi:integrase
MSSELALYYALRTIFVLPDASKDARYRLAKFAKWMAVNGRPWHEPDLARYRDALLDTYAATTVSAHLSTVRARYRELMDDDAIRETLAADSQANRDDIMARLAQAVDPRTSPVKRQARQDRQDSEQIRLTAAQANALLSAPGVATLAGLRDTAVIALILCTGIRETELCALDVSDLRQSSEGIPALQVREGKGCIPRLVPYGELAWILDIVYTWLSAAGIDRGAIFRSFYRGHRKLRPGRLSVRSIEYIVGGYPVPVNGDVVSVKPQDLRRTYARRLYDAGCDPVAIQRNLGHADLKTTLGYVGEREAERRTPPAIYTFDLDRLDDAPVQGRIRE